MSRAEQINGIAKILCSNCMGDVGSCSFDKQPCERVLKDAEAIYENGYHQHNKLTLQNKETIQRMLGKIEGVAFVLDDKFATPILDAIEVIDVILDKMKGGAE